MFFRERFFPRTFRAQARLWYRALGLLRHTDYILTVLIDKPRDAFVSVTRGCNCEFAIAATLCYISETVRVSAKVTILLTRFLTVIIVSSVSRALCFCVRRNTSSHAVCRSHCTWPKQFGGAERSGAWSREPLSVIGAESWGRSRAVGCSVERRLSG